MLLGQNSLPPCHPKSERRSRRSCGSRPRGAVEVTPLLPPFAQAADGRRRIDLAQGSEREIAILFADIRDFTALSEGRLPYDVVFVLNRYPFCPRTNLIMREVEGIDLKKQIVTISPGFVHASSSSDTNTWSSLSATLPTFMACPA
jgi:hypothetical protein